MVTRHHKGRPLFLKILVTVFFLGCILVCFAAGFIDALVRHYSLDLPSVNKLATYEPSLTTRIYASNGDLIATLYKEDRVWVPLSHIPKVMQDAIVSIEDSRFYEHPGVDFVGVLRSFWVNVAYGRTEQGASTLTMQLARRVFLTPQVTLERKIREIILATRIEKHFSKQQILEMYLNNIYLGSGSYGVEAAAQHYFGKHAEALTLPEAAIIAGLPAAPTEYSPQVDMEAAKARQVLVLERMADLGFISQHQAMEAIHAPLHIAPPHTHMSLLKYPYFSSYVIHELSEQFPNDQLYQGGLKIYTTLDPHLQNLAQAAVKKGIQVADQQGYNVHQAALVAIEPHTGYIRAMVGGKKWSLQDQFNRAWQAQRQPGSTFKIFVYSTALEDGYTPDSMITDAPFAVRVNSADVYAPHNSDGRFWGTMPIRKALQFSRDIPAIRMLNQLGIQQVIDTANRLGIQEHLDPVLPLALGAADVTPLELASAVSTLPNLGSHIEPTCIKKVYDANGHLLEDNTHPYRERVLSEQTAFAMDEMLENVIAAGTGTAAQIDRPAGGKTGTTDSHRDAWFVGFTPDLLTAVWTGNDDYTPTLGGFGGTVAAPIWHDFMQPALAGRPKQQFGVVQNGKIGVLMCADSHERAAATCPHVVREYFAPDKVPQKWCTAHTLHSVNTPMASINYGTFSTPPAVRQHAQPEVAAIPIVHTAPIHHYTPWHRSHAVSPAPAPHLQATPVPLTVAPPPPLAPAPAPPPPPPSPAPRPRPRYVAPTPTPWVNPGNVQQRSRQDEDFDFEHQ